MQKLLLAALVVLAALYGAKVLLLQVATQPELSAEDDEDSGEGFRAGSGALFSAGGGDGWEPLAPREASGNTTELQAAARATRRGLDTEAVMHLQACLEHQGGERSAVVVAACQTALGEFQLVGAGGLAPSLSKAEALFKQAADNGDADAQFNLGVYYGAIQDPPNAGKRDTKRLEALAILNLYAASTAGHPGALMAMGYRHIHGFGVPKSCSAAALNYIDVAKRVANIYSAGMPQAVELIRLNLHHKDRKVVSSSEMNLFAQIATSGDATVASAIGKRYLLGIEGFRQDYRRARHFLRLAANQNHAGALAMLGYMYCLGLGVAKNLDVAYSHFVSSAALNDPLGHNGLGYIYFKGSTNQNRNLHLAFKHFNESAFGGSSDGMFNLASMFLTGTGTDQSFQKAVLFYTQALDRGHTPAAYSLAVMHLNGIGVVRDCDIAVNLLKKVCERGEWVSGKLVDANEHGEKRPDRAAWLFLKLAEAGHEVAQMNMAHLLDTGAATLLHQEEDGAWQKEHELAAGGGSVSYEVRDRGRVLAQRYYELSADQGCASSELRLGDYAYYGWGVIAKFMAEDTASEKASPLSGAYEREPEPDGAEYDSDELEDLIAELGGEPELETLPQPVDYEASLAHYRRAAEMTVTGEWMQAFVARGFFNLGFMYQFGFGADQDLNMAKQHYQRCREMDPSGLHTPVTIVLMLLVVHMYYLRLPPWDVALERVGSDIRVHILVMHLVSIIALLVARRQITVGRGPRPRRAPPSTTATAAAANLRPAPAADNAGADVRGAPQGVGGFGCRAVQGTPNQAGQDMVL